MTIPRPELFAALLLDAGSGLRRAQPRFDQFRWTACHFRLALQLVGATPLFSNFGKSFES